MKKFITSILASTVAFMAANAATPFDSENNRPHWGARIALDVSTPTDARNGDFSVNLFDAGAGVSFGAVYNLPLVANLYLEPGAMFFYDTFGIDIDMLDEDLTTVKAKASMRQFGLRIPVQIGYHFDLEPCQIHLFTGPEFSLGFSGRQHVSAKSSGVTVSESENCYKSGGLNRGNFAWKIGAAVSVDHYYLSLSGAFGSNILNDWNGTKSKSRIVSLALGYNF